MDFNDKDKNLIDFEKSCQHMKHLMLMAQWERSSILTTSSCKACIHAGSNRSLNRPSLSESLQALTKSRSIDLFSYFDSLPMMASRPQ
jgi:hypothetical protein